MGIAGIAFGTYFDFSPETSAMSRSVSMHWNTCARDAFSAISSRRALQSGHRQMVLSQTRIKNRVLTHGGGWSSLVDVVLSML